MRDMEQREEDYCHTKLCQLPLEEKFDSMD